MDQKKINVKRLLDKFELTLSNRATDLNYKDILAPAVKQIGLELAGIEVTKSYHDNVICWGESENNYFIGLGEKQAKEIIARILKKQPPLLILSRGVKEQVFNWIITLADSYKVPVYWSKNSTNTIIVTIGTYLNDFFSPEVQVHGCLITLGGTGVLITGKSGVGKSEATLELIQKGHVFISDDAVLIRHIGSNFYGIAPELTRNFLEVRGLGLIDIKYTYGIKSIAEGAVIDLVVELVQANEENVIFDRLGTDNLRYEILDGSLPLIRIPVKNGFSSGTLIEAAVSTFLARKDGVSVLEQIISRKELVNG
ncbi:HPr(Ser) kinase/phosphatase [Mycoplasmopsis columbinasalis]|uniref:HPr kinase/phosphorylase n=1 Tax=Mycoplasmopsis columbinasalis TaxID=114880 RepID=A0A449BA63_9BACT|nr:HPr(Ser) kinase/phosphatase [Mycoplasmopsis columbinasalis]VEU77996.1 HPr kinase/phosphorylase [Mycoplasmopsis columbinasalis]